MNLFRTFNTILASSLLTVFLMGASAADPSSTKSVEWTYNSGQQQSQTGPYNNSFGKSNQAVEWTYSPTRNDRQVEWTYQPSGSDTKQVEWTYSPGQNNRQVKWTYQPSPSR